MLIALLLGSITAFACAAPSARAEDDPALPEGARWEVQQPDAPLPAGINLPGFKPEVDFKYPIGFTGIADDARVPVVCLQKYNPFKEYKRNDNCTILGGAIYRRDIIPATAKKIVGSATDSYGDDAKKSAVASMEKMMGAVTWAWTTPLFNPQLAKVTQAQGTGKDAVCEGPETTTREGLVGDKCYQVVTPLRSMQKDFDPIIGGLMVLAILIGCARVSIEMRADGLLAVLRAIATTIVVAGLLAVVVQVVLAITDSLTVSIMASAPGPNDPGLQNVAAMGEVLKSPQFAGIGLIAVLVIGLLVMFAAAAQIALMVFRMAVIPALVVFAPVAAATSSTQVGAQWLKKSLMYLLAFVIYKPVAAATYVLGLRLLSFSGSTEQLKGPQGEVWAITQVIAAGTLMLLTVALLPVLLKFLVPVAGAGMSSMFSGAAVAGGVAAGAVAVGSAVGSSGVLSGAGMAARGAATAGAPMAGGPVGAAGTGAPATGSGTGGSAGTAGGGSPTGAASTTSTAGAASTTSTAGAAGGEGTGAVKQPAGELEGSPAGAGDRPALDPPPGEGGGDVVKSPARAHGPGSGWGETGAGSSGGAGPQGAGSSGTGSGSAEPGVAGPTGPAGQSGPAGSSGPAGATGSGGTARGGVGRGVGTGFGDVGTRMMDEEPGDV
ncbi:hypothetical protein [Enemella evansiae]|uniref:hypothetical protein n=1 Tax=Enemella evansiae TaxID=2016499 RepID=UPI00113FD66B|nr:hypothetical protein [Enemella evansiae]